MNILITGITGFVGSHMADYILKHTDDHIYGFKRWMEDTKNIDHLIDNPRVTLFSGDLVDYASVDRAVRLSNPNKIFHFAAQSFPESSFKNPIITLHTNVLGTTHLFESIKTNKLNPVMPPRNLLAALTPLNIAPPGAPNSTAIAPTSPRKVSGSVNLPSLTDLS